MRQDLHAERTKDAGGDLPDAAETDDPGSLALEFHNGVVPEAPVARPAAAALADLGVVVGHAVRQLQQQGDGILADGLAAVARHVADRNAKLAAAVHIHGIVARGDDADEFQIFALPKRLGSQHGLVEQDDLGVPDARGSFLRLGMGIEHSLAQRLQGRPVQLAGILPRLIQ